MVFCLLKAISIESEFQEAKNRGECKLIHEVDPLSVAISLFIGCGAKVHDCAQKFTPVCN